MTEYDQGAWGATPLEDGAAPAFAGLGAYEAAPPALPSPTASAPEPPLSVMMSPSAAVPVGYRDQPLMDTSQSVSFHLPTAPSQPIFAQHAQPVQPATGPYRSAAPFATPTRRGGMMRRRGLGEPPARTSAMLGLSLLVVGVGVAVGARSAGLFGGIAGGLYGGASINAIRAVKSLTDGQPASDHEAAISGTYAILGAGVATYVLYRTRAENKKG